MSRTKSNLTPKGVRAIILFVTGGLALALLAGCSSSGAARPSVSPTRPASPSPSHGPLPSAYGSPGSESQKAIDLMLRMDEVPPGLKQVLAPKAVSIADLFGQQVQQGKLSQAMLDSWQVTGGAVCAYEATDKNSKVLLLGPNVIVFATAQGAAEMFQNSKQNLRREDIEAIEKRTLDSYSATAVSLGDEGWAVHYVTTIIDNYQIVMRRGRIVASVFIRAKKDYLPGAALDVAARQEQRLDLSGQ